MVHLSEHLLQDPHKQAGCDGLLTGEADLSGLQKLTGWAASPMW